MQAQNTVEPQPHPVLSKRLIAFKTALLVEAIFSLLVFGAFVISGRAVPGAAVLAWIVIGCDISIGLLAVRNLRHAATTKPRVLGALFVVLHVCLAAGLCITAYQASRWLTGSPWLAISVVAGSVVLSAMLTSYPLFRAPGLVVQSSDVPSNGWAASLAWLVALLFIKIGFVFGTTQLFFGSSEIARCDQARATMRTLMLHTVCYTQNHRGWFPGASEVQQDREMRLLVPPPAWNRPVAYIYLRDEMDRVFCIKYHTFIEGIRPHELPVIWEDQTRGNAFRVVGFQDGSAAAIPESEFEDVLRRLVARRDR